MITRVIEILGDIIKSLIPNHQLRTKEWIARLLVSTLIVIIIGAVTVVGLRGTGLGERIGINPVNSSLSQLSHAEFVSSFQDMWQAITGVQEQNSDVRSTFVIALIDKETGNIVSSPEAKSTYGLIWVWSLPADKFSFLNNFQQAFNDLKPKFENKLREEGRCLSGGIEKPVLDSLRRGVSNFQSTHFSICPIFAKKDYRLVAATVAFYRNPNNQELFYYEDLLRRATSFVENKFNSFKTRYEFFYN